MEAGTNRHMERETATLELPPGLIHPEQAYPVVFISTAGMDLSDTAVGAIVNEALYRSFDRVHAGSVSGQTLLKVHIGEPKCVTRMKPEYMTSSARFLRERGASCVVAGDTTVAYSGPRGHRDNPAGNTDSYLKLAERHGWSLRGAGDVRFAVLDRPSTSVSGRFEFDTACEEAEIDGVRRYTSFYPAGGFDAADFVINHAHLTLHGLAGVAGCVKSIAMGCSALQGKLVMHQAMLPEFDIELCKACGRCVESCPENALILSSEDECPTVEPDRCIGCGECVAVCSQGAVALQGQRITDWARGTDSLPYRMTDCVAGLMNGRWEHTIHVLHMYTITGRCDCVDVKQKPLLEKELGFLVSKNPFAVDRLAGQLLAEAVGKMNCPVDESLLQGAEASARYAQQTYGILGETPVETIPLS